MDPLEDCMLSNFLLKKKIPCLLISIYKKNNNVKESVRFHGNLWQTWKFIRYPVFSSFYKNSQQGLALALHRFASLTLNCFKKFLSTITLMFLQIYQTAPDKLLYIKTVFCCNFCLTFAGSWKFIENAKSEREFEWKIGNKKPLLWQFQTAFHLLSARAWFQAGHLQFKRMNQTE